MRTRLGMLIRAGSSNREMVGALGVNIKLLYTLVFGLGAALAGLAGLMQAPDPHRTDRHGREHPDPRLCRHHHRRHRLDPRRVRRRVLVGLIDTLGRAFLPDLLRLLLSTNAALTLASAVSSMSIYVLMAGILVFRPEGLFPAAGR